MRYDLIAVSSIRPQGLPRRDAQCELGEPP
jgi:hypothetical protein